MKKGMSSDEFRRNVKLDAFQLAQGICENEYYKNYITEMTYTCLYIMQDHKESFLRPFIGAPIEEYRQTKGNFFDKSKEICSKTLRACPIEFYEKGEVPVSERTSCTACHIMGDDIEMIMNVAKYAAPTQLLESVCVSLGFKHKPHTWIEELCEEIVEDHSQEMTDVMGQHLKLIRKGAKYEPFDHVLANKMCKKVLKCPELYVPQAEAPIDISDPHRFAQTEL